MWGRDGTKAGPRCSLTPPTPDEPPHVHPLIPASAVLDFRLCHENPTSPPPAATLEASRSTQTSFRKVFAHRNLCASPSPRPRKPWSTGSYSSESLPHVIGETSSQVHARSVWGRSRGCDVSVPVVF